MGFAGEDWSLIRAAARRVRDLAFLSGTSGTETWRWGFFFLFLVGQEVDRWIGRLHFGMERFGIYLTLWALQEDDLGEMRMAAPQHMVLRRARS